MIEQHNPMHPGEFIQRVYLIPFNIGSNELAKRLKVSNGSVSRLINGKTDVTPSMALKLSIVLKQSPESWLQMQDNYNLYQAKKEFDLNDYEPFKLAM
jgi:addiction module HigA family antidote